MLPLWILDITKQSERRDEFQKLLAQIDHVFIEERGKTPTVTTHPTSTPEDPASGEEFDVLPEKTNYSDYNKNGSDISVNHEEAENEYDGAKDTTVKDNKVKTLEEQIEEEEKKKAAREAIIKGNYWYYSSVSYEDFFTYEDFYTDYDFKNPEHALLIEGLSQRLYNFQESIVAMAKSFIKELRSSNIKPFQTINIIVLGDATEALTQLVFASIAALLQKEKGRFLPGHIHQGMCVFGMLYVPCDINTRHTNDRAKILRLFNEIEVQHQLTNIRGYDFMILYQDVQNRTECNYPRLDEKRQAEYLLQNIVHQFLACDNNHPLFHGTATDDAFYVSMGATSVFFDMTYEDKNDANRVAYGIVNTFKEEGDNEKPDPTLQLLDKELYHVDTFVKQVNVERFDIDDVFDKSPNPHPIKDFLNRNLKKLYYLYHLRYYPAELLREILQRTEEATSNQLDEISAYCTNTFKSAQITMLPSINTVISKLNQHVGGISTLEYLFKDLQEQMSKEKSNIQQAIEEDYWQKVMYGIPLVPSDQIDHFEEYHEAYLNDVKSKNNSAGCESMKQTIMAKLKNLLGREKTTLATLSRSFFLGILSVMGILPILDFISPRFINLGDVGGHAFPWAVGLFMLPLFIQIVSMMLYLRKRANCVRVLKAYYNHDAYSRIANRIEFEAVEFYDKMIALCDEYLKRCKRIRQEVGIPVPSPEAKTVFPLSMFNQPLNGGHFGDDFLIPSSEVEGCRIRVNYMPRFVNELEKEHYFMLINHFNDELSMLFGNVGIIEPHARRFDEELGDYVFVSRDEQLKEKEENWERTKLEFRRQLMNGIQGEMIPREHPTVGEMLIQYKKKIDKLDLLEPMIAYAATNGEITSQFDTEFADVKVNLDIDDLVSAYLPLYTTRLQTEKHDELYKKLIFVTRWRTFEHFSFNRILPKEDFDQEIRRQRIYEEEMKAARQKDDKELPEEQKSIPLSSLILWSICPDGNSGEWLKLFDAARFKESYDYRNTFRRKLNQND